MTDNEVIVRVKAKAETAEVEALDKQLKDLASTDTEIETKVIGDGEENIIQMKKVADNLDGTSIWVDIEADDDDYESTIKEIRNADGEVINVSVRIDEADDLNSDLFKELQNSYTIPIDIDLSDKSLMQITDTLDSINGELINVELDVDDNDVIKTRLEVEDLDGNKINLNCNVVSDVRDLDFIKKELYELMTDPHTIHTNLSIEGVEGLVNLRKDVTLLDGSSIWVQCKADGTELEEPIKVIKNIDGEIIDVKVDVDDSEFKTMSDTVNSFKKKKIEVDIDLDHAPLNSIKKIINDLKGEKVDVNVVVDESGVESLKLDIQDINGEHVEVTVDTDGSSFDAVKQEIESLNGENISVTVDVDDTAIRNAKSEMEGIAQSAKGDLGSMDNAITGVISGMAGKSMWDAVYGNTTRAETNQILLKNMADTGKSADDLYGHIDTLTDNSLISMQSLIPALNGIKAATGANASEIDNASEGVAAFGQYVLALTGSEAKAETAMFDLSKGIKGAFASLDQYGITEDALMRTGLWSGKEDDLEGYIAAVNEVTGSTEELMGTATGLEALMGKAFSRGGKKIGNELLPYIKMALQGFLGLDNALGGWLSAGLLGISGVVTGLTSVLSAVGQVGNGIKMMKEGWKSLKDTVGGVGEKLSNFKQSILDAMNNAKSHIDSLKAKFDYLKQSLGQGWESLKNSIGGVGDKLRSFKDSISDAFNGAKMHIDSFKTKIGSLKQSVADLGSRISNSLSTGWNSAKTAISSGVDALKVKFASLKTAIINAGNAIRTAAANFVNFGRTLITNVGSAAKNLATSLVNLGRSALTAGANALRSAAMWLVQKVQVVASTVANWAATASQWALNIAMSANPIMIVVLAIIALVAILGYLYFNNEQVRQAVDGLGQAFIMVGQIIYTSIIGAIQWVIAALEGLWNYIMTLGGLLPAQVSITGNSIIDSVLAVLMFIATLPLQLAMIFTNIIARVLGFGNNFSQRMIQAASKAVSNFGSQISQLPGKLSAELQNMLSLVNDWAATLPAKFWEAGVNAVKNFLNALGIRSPGTMQRMMVWEVSEMARRVPIEGKALISNIGDLGSDIVNSFGKPKMDFDIKGSGIVDSLNVKHIAGSDNVANLLSEIIVYIKEIVKNGGGNGSTVINIGGDVDSDKRINEIIDVIHKELSWNNETAGRTV